MSLEKLIRENLGCKSVRSVGRGGAGCISEGRGFLIDDKDHVFIKMNGESKALLMFKGEFHSLTAIRETGQIRAPKPMAIVENPDGGAMLVMEYLNIRSLSRACAAQLGSSIARLHLHNAELSEKNHSSYVDRFGFHIQTCCGYLPQGNEWNPCWTSFFINKLQEQMDMVRRDYNDKLAEDLWRKIREKIPAYFAGLHIKPALLHGDLWSGNAGEVDGQPVVFDAACFYGHHEYDLGIAGMFGGFGPEFYNAYHQLIPKAEGFEKRSNLYQLFHYLNHWNHFGQSYRSPSIMIMNKLILE